MKYFLFTVLGMFLMYIILKIVSSKPPLESAAFNYQLARLVSTGQFNNLIKTNEARELIKTPEFRTFVGSLAKSQIQTLSKSLVNYESK